MNQTIADQNGTHPTALEAANDAVEKAEIEVARLKKDSTKKARTLADAAEAYKTAKAESDAADVALKQARRRLETAEDKQRAEQGKVA